MRSALWSVVSIIKYSINHFGCLISVCLCEEQDGERQEFTEDADVPSASAPVEASGPKRPRAAGSTERQRKISEND